VKKGCFGRIVVGVCRAIGPRREKIRRKSGNGGKSLKSRAEKEEHFWNGVGRDHWDTERKRGDNKSIVSSEKEGGLGGSKKA